MIGRRQLSGFGEGGLKVSALISRYARGFCTSGSSKPANVIALGVFKKAKVETKASSCNEEENSAPILSQEAANVDSKKDLQALLSNSNFSGENGKLRVFYEREVDGSMVACFGAGTSDPTSLSKENAGCIDLGRDAIRKATASAVRGLKADLKNCNIKLDCLGDAEAAAEGAFLGTYNFSLKSKKSKDSAKVSPIDEGEETLKAWKRGWSLASAQNFSRDLMNLPASHMNPTLFCEKVTEKLNAIQKNMNSGASLSVTVRDEDWVKSKKMGAFLSVSEGARTPLKMLEIHYRNAPVKDSKPVILVGKGVTFDTGGYSLKPAAGMGDMRGDMGGAATCVGAMMAITEMELPVNVSVITPLCENAISGGATKPGDVVTAMDGTTIEVDNTDAEGRLILADAILHAKSMAPKAIVDVATLTGAAVVAVGPVTAAYTNSEKLWGHISTASMSTGDLVWRMPLWNDVYMKMVKSDYADIKNVGGKGAGSCTAAIFLNKFARAQFPKDANPSDFEYAHLDIAGVMKSEASAGHEVKGMAGAPTRMLVDLVTRIADRD
eukprot:Nk52_evm30s292 gene=Nk52_evmTU30s292